jgi:hypothetical protein
MATTIEAARGRECGGNDRPAARGDFAPEYPPLLQRPERLAEGPFAAV